MDNVLQFVAAAYRRYGLFWQRKMPPHPGLARVEKSSQVVTQLFR